MKKLLIILLGIIILAGAGAATYFFYFAPQPTAERTANNAMMAASLNQPEKISLTQQNESLSVADFVSASSQRNFKQVATTQSDSIFYISFQFTDDQTPKKARIAVANSAIRSLAVGDLLGNLPKDDKEDEAIAAQSFDHCLSKEDLQYLDSTKLYARNFRAATMIFAPDSSLSYSGEVNGNRLLDRIGNFYKKSHTKDYQVMLRGYAPDPEKHQEAYEKQLSESNNRATKIHDDLVKRGVSRDRITIDDPIIYNQTPPDVQDNYVNIDIVNKCI